MSTTDQILDKVQREVEYDGTSHATCVFINDLTLIVTRNGYETPHLSSVREELFDADFSCILESLNSSEHWGTLAVLNQDRAQNFPRAVCAQFVETDHRILDMIVTLTCCDVYGDLVDDVVSANLMLFRLCDESGYSPGDIHFNIGVAYALYTDMEYIEEDIIDWGD